MIALILLIAAVILFILAAVNVSHPRINLVAAGLACAGFALWILPHLSK